MSQTTFREGPRLRLLAAAALLVGLACSQGGGSSTKVQGGPPSLPSPESQKLGGPIGNSGSNMESDAEVCPSPRIDLRVLVLAARDDEPVLGAISETLEGLGTPFTLWVATREEPVTAARLYQDCHAFFQAVFLTNGDLAFFDEQGAWRSALAAEEWAALADFEKRFGVRQVSLYTYPSAATGFGAPQAISTDEKALTTRLTPEGERVFGYLAPGARIDVSNAWTYLARPLDAQTLPLLVDDAGNALAALRTLADGRETLSLTFDGNPYLIHSMVLGYGLVSWATRGLFIGERRAMLSAQVDDVLIDNDLWPTGLYRMDGPDLEALAAWQDARGATRLLSGFRLDFAFNGEGATGIYSPDTLTPAVRRLESKFKWINHTFTHLNLDAVSAREATTEIRKNREMAKKLSLGVLSDLNLVTPDVSGLSNPAFLKAAYAEKIRYLVCDTSLGCRGETPNTGVYNPYFPFLLMLPRYPTNLFYNASTPDEWVGEYNEMYRAFWGRDLSYPELLDKESQVLVSYLLKGDLNPLMFHQANLRAYDGKRSLLGDLIDATVAKYGALYSLPILSPTMDELAAAMKRRMDLRAATVTASTLLGSLTLRSDRAVLVPITGLCRSEADRYGETCSAWLKVPAKTPLTVKLPAAP